MALKINSSVGKVIYAFLFVVVLPLLMIFWAIKFDCWNIHHYWWSIDHDIWFYWAYFAW
jgi:hypothetical protein